MKKFFFAFLGLVALCACESSDITELRCGAYNVEIKAFNDGENLHARINDDAVEMELEYIESKDYYGYIGGTKINLWHESGIWWLIFDDDESIECQ